MNTPNSYMADLKCFRASDAKRMWREGIKERDGHKCVYCHSTTDLTIDHVRPQCRGGSTTADNCVTACRSCNQAKGSLNINQFLNINGISYIAS